ncbi:MAG: hypothetical protein DYG93_05795 [Leptolyngbya sp. PLA2]|nr:hypothetical protein [Leptolyngbya sp.]MCE7971162.1 hypothetical protein [Leptolyngbya sp. PL-A2]MCQ3940841.1 hypothetical protein [cyanobacterium CYA1]MCZ7634137.1 hypothetical protein [Phycisphaerales bacterium]MDL1905156.1 hypothetical protein [Synechococcales cyanobacterium CNB]GIK19295.1 MAG: hypothetical protein BroJett004_14590 [Planctomycetota bacterium]
MGARIVRLAGLVRAGTLAVVLLAAHASAQPIGGLRDDLITKITALSSAETDEIRQFTEPRLVALAGEDAAARERARAELVASLRRPGVSVAFRQAYRGVMLDRLTPLASDARDEVAINALLILGELADDAAARVVMERTGDDRQTVRYAAIAALTTSFRAARDQAPALTPATAGRIVDHLGERLRTERDAWTADAVARSLIAAGSIGRAEFAPSAQNAWVALAEGVGDRLYAAQPGPERRIALLTAMRAGEAMRDAITTPAGIGDRATRAAASLGGETIGFVARLLERGELASGERRFETDLVNVGENLVFFSRQKLLPNPPQQTRLADTLGAGQDSDYRNTARRLVAELTQPPVSMPQNRATRWFN